MFIVFFYKCLEISAFSRGLIFFLYISSSFLLFYNLFYYKQLFKKNFAFIANIL